MIDPTLFDFQSIFTVVAGTNRMKRKQLLPLRAEIIELAIEKYSGGQLKYVGASAIGYDFVGVHDGLKYESKSLDDMFGTKCFKTFLQGTKKHVTKTGYTKPFEVKNHRSKNNGNPSQTFDHILLWDTKNFTAGIADWSAVEKHFKSNDATVKSKVDVNDVQLICVNSSHNPPFDFEKHIMQLIRASI